MIIAVTQTGSEYTVEDHTGGWQIVLFHIAKVPNPEG